MTEAEAAPGRAGEDGWWAPALSLAERLAGPPPPPAPGGRRLDRWHKEFEGRLDEFLADLGADRDLLAALLAEPAAQLAARFPEPDWVPFVRRALAAAPDTAAAPPARDGGGPVAPPVHAAAGSARRTVEPSAPPAWAAAAVLAAATAPAPPAGPAPWAVGFAGVLTPFTAAALAELRAAPAWRALRRTAELDSLERDFQVGLASLLVHVARRTLVLELNVLRVGGGLRGADGEARFADFLRQAGTRGRLTALCAEYPVLARLLADTARDTVAAWAELAERFTADRDALVREVLGGTDPGPLARVAVGAGDRHGRGRTVAVLHFADGRRAVYKPRPLAVHRHYNDLLRLLTGLVPNAELATLAVLDRGGHGWVEFAEAAPCADRRGVDRFYRRLGLQLALLHVLGGTDVHYENLVARGDQPVLVDVETLFHPDQGQPAPLGGDPAQRVLAGSVHRIALLPFPMLGEHGVADLSGLGGDDGAPLPVAVPGWDGAGTDRMRLVPERGRLRGAANRPRLGGADADPARHAEPLVAGFRAGYRALAAAAPRIAAPGGPLDRFAADTVRVVARPTRRYGALLEEATHPDALRDALDRDLLFTALWRESADDPARRPLVRDELDALRRGDVPLFTTTPAADPADPDGPPHGSGGLARARRRLLALDRTDLYDQEWIVRAALATRGGAASRAARPTGGPQPPVAPDPDRLLAAACDLADRVLARAHGDRRRVNWLTLERITDRDWALMPQGAGLDGGYPGTALFLAQLAALTGTARYAETARRAVRPLPALLSALAADPAHTAAVGAGGFTGLGGIAYAAARLAALLDEEPAGPLHGAAARAVALTARAARTAPAEDDDPGRQLLSGDAGCLAAMLAVHRLTGNPEAAAVADRCAERLAATPDPAPDGAALRDWALHRWTAERTPGPLGPAAVPAPGPLGPAAALAAARTPGGPAPAAPAAGEVADHSLLHGESAVLELLLATGSGRPALTGAAATRAGALLGDLDLAGPRCATPAGVPTPGLLTGLAGIGHTLLRLAHPAEVPCVLLLEALPDRPPPPT
ncbi:type 2 lanthipeptide synthetase LanM family protein [Kitasatospora sp. NPDC088391]|uniref:type 2 lanthipeptide synthetase LanM family protein n=1 Tax=Kitasatospora sp. NPDC088391 TaxID=3364074 RepID=UPI0037F50D2F